MKRISFSMTEPAILDRSKTVTRRLGWKTLQPGTRLLAVNKCMGLKKGEKQRLLAEIEVVDVRREPLAAITADDVAREGYPDAAPDWFISKFCEAVRCTPDVEVTRIEFRYVEVAP